VPPNVTTGGPGRGDGGAVVHADLVGVGADGDLGGFAGVRQADLNPLAADHDRAADRDPPSDDQGIGQTRHLDGAGACSAQPEAGLLGNRAGDGPDQDAAGHDVRHRAVEAHRDPLPGQRQARAHHVVADGDVPGRGDDPVDLGDAACLRGKRRRPSAEIFHGCWRGRRPARRPRMAPSSTRPALSYLTTVPLLRTSA